MNPAVSIVDQYCFDVYVGSKNIAGTKKGKLDIAPLNHLPLLPSGPGGFDRSWSYKTYPLQKYNFFFKTAPKCYIFYQKKYSNATALRQCTLTNSLYLKSDYIRILTS